MRTIIAIAFLISIQTASAIEPQDSIWRTSELEQIVVTGTRTPKLLKDAPIQTRLITAEDIVKADATNIEELLRQELPGVEFSYAMNQQTHLNFSGFGGQSVLFLVDGERLAGETMDDVDFSRLNMANIERIEIIKGAASALYGSNATGGVINIITKTPQEPWNLNINGRSSKHNEWRYGMNLGVNSAKLQNILSFTGTNIDSYNVSNGKNPQTINMVRTFYGDKSYNVSDKLTWQPNTDVSLVARAGYYFRQKQTTTPTLPDHYRDLTLGIRGKWNITENDILELSYNFDQYDKAQHQQITDLCIRTYSNVQNSVRGLYNHTFADGNVLTIGGDFLRDYLLNAKTAEGRYTQNTADVFIQYDWNVNEKLEIIGALRYDYFSDGKSHQLTPKVNLCYKIADNCRMRAGYGMGFRAPTLKEKYYIFNMAGIWDVVGSEVIGNSLKPEKSHNLNISAEYSHGRYNFTASTYYNIIRNRITTGAPQLTSDFKGDKSQLGTDKWLPYTNIARYNSFGFDLTTQVRWQNGFSARLSYAYVHEELPKDDNGETINNQYTPARPHTLTSRLEWDHNYSKNYGLNIALHGRFLSAVDNMEYVDYTSRNPQTNHLLRKTVNYKAYTIWRLSTVQRIFKAFRVTVAIDNIFNYNPEYHYFNAPFTDGANLQIGLSIDIDKIKL